jgi:antitoxin component YwqK of YwqJK toxin-antitoxin module
MNPGICSTLVLLSTILVVRGQNTDTARTGYYTERNGLVEVYYKNGLRNGIYKGYYRKERRLAAIGEYKDNERSGTWYFFDEQGRLLMKETNICPNYSYKIIVAGKELMPRFSSYIYIFYSNGCLQGEGVALYNGDIEVDFYRWGEWKYYDVDGTFLGREPKPAK